MRKRTLVPVAALSLMAVTLAGCSGSQPDDGTVNLVFRQFDPADQVQGLVDAVDEWNAENPNVQVQLETLSPNNPQQLAREANSGSGPDIAQVAFADVSFLAEPSILLPLDDLMASSPIDGADELLATDMTTFDDQTWAVPWTADTMALVYRADVLETAGVASTPQTWEELKESAAKITESSGGDVSGFCFPGGAQQNSAQWFPINYYLWDQGAELISNEGGEWSVGVTESQLAGALDYFNGFFTDGITPAAMQAITDYADPSITAGLDSGSCAMTFMPPAAFRTAQASISTEITTAPMPGGLNDGSTHLGGRGLAINANTEHPEEAWEFLKYLLGAETFDGYEQYPASAKTLTELDVDPSEQGYVDQLPHSRSFAVYIGSPLTVASMQELVNQQFSAVYSGQSDSATAARAIISELERGLQQ